MINAVKMNCLTVKYVSSANWNSKHSGSWVPLFRIGFNSSKQLEVLELVQQSSKNTMYNSVGGGGESGLELPEILPFDSSGHISGI